MPIQSSAINKIAAVILQGDPRYVNGLSYNVGTCRAQGVTHPPFSSISTLLTRHTVRASPVWIPMQIPRSKHPILLWLHRSILLQWQRCQFAPAIWLQVWPAGVVVRQEQVVCLRRRYASHHTAILGNPYLITRHRWNVAKICAMRRHWMGRKWHLWSRYYLHLLERVLLSVLVNASSPSLELGFKKVGGWWYFSCKYSFRLCTWRHFVWILNPLISTSCFSLYYAAPPPSLLHSLFIWHVLCTRSLLKMPSVQQSSLVARRTSLLLFH